MESVLLVLSCTRRRPVKVMKFLILFLFCGALCQVPVPTMLPALVPETLTDLSREPMEDFDEIKKKAGEDDLESNVEVKADSTWPAQITVYEELRDDEASHDKSPSSDSVTEEACIDENMEWNSCGPRCSQTCAFQPRGVRKSRAICEPLLTSNGCYKGCFCKKGYVRLSDKCVLSENCPSEFRRN